MPTFFAAEAGLYANPANANPSLASAVVHGGEIRRYRATITLASQASGDDIVLADLTAGQAVAYGIITSSVSLGSSTVAIGITGATGKYRAAAAFTAVDTPTLFGPTAANMAAAPTTANERVRATIAAAAFPASGTLVIDLYVSGV